MDDPYHHDDPSLMYTAVSIPGKGCPDAFYEEISGWCECGDGCKSSCPCTVGQRAAYDDKGLLLRPDAPVLECKPSCRCSNCVNRVVQRGPVDGLEVKMTDDKGMGLFAGRAIEKGAFVCTYSGEVISKEEGVRRSASDESLGRTCNYVLFVRETFDKASPVSFVVDPTFIGNVGRYINHACGPNLVMAPVRTDSMLPQLALFANQLIPPGNELTFNYGNPSLVLDDVTDVQGSGTKKCFCRTNNCQKFLPFSQLS